MPPKRTRAQHNEEKECQSMKADDLVAVFGYNDDIVYIPLRSITIYYATFPTLTSRLPYATFGIKRGTYTVYMQLSRMVLYRREKPNSVRTGVSFNSVIFTNTEEKKTLMTSLSSCLVSAIHSDGAQFNCKLEDLLVTTDTDEKPFKFRDCFFHEEFSRAVHMVLKKTQKRPREVKQHEPEEEKKENSHLSMFS